MKILSALMILAVGAIVLAGCGGGETADEAATKKRAANVNTDTKTSQGNTIKPSGTD